MFRDTILWVSDAPQASAADHLESAGYVVLRARVREALAVLFVNRSIDAVVLNAGGSPSDNLMLARALRAIRHEIPIFLVSKSEEAAASSLEGCFVVGDLEQIVPRLHAAMPKPAV